MVNTLGWAELEVRPTFSSSFDRDIDARTGRAMASAGASGGSRYGDAAGRSLVSRFSSHAATAAKIGAGIIAGGIAASGYAAFRIGSTSLDEAYEAIKVGNLTKQVIETTGGAANVTAAQVGDLSEKLSLKTGVDDEQIQRGANMILTFKNIGNQVGKNNDIFNQSVAITEDMAAAMAGGQGGNGFDLKSSSILVGKALNDPIKGLTALSRVGVTFTDQQKKNIESLIEQGDRLGAQKIILGELKSEFGGAAEAQATLGEKVSVAWGNIEERLGKDLLPLVRDVQRAILRDGLPAAERFSGWFRSEGVPKVRDFIREIKPLAHEVLPAVATVFGDVRDVAHDALPYIKDVVGAFNDMPEWATKGLAIGGLGLLAGKKTGVIGGGSTGGGLLGGLSSKGAVRVFVTNPGFSTKNGPTGQPTDLDGERRPSRETRRGRGARTAGGAAALFALTDPEMVAENVKAWLNEGKAEALWPWQEGPFAPRQSSKAYQGTESRIEANTDGGGAGLSKLLLSPAELQQQKAGLTELISGTSKLGQSVDSLPKQLVTKFVAPGLVDNRKDAMELAKRYDLTAGQRTTLFKVTGTEKVKRDTNDVLDLYRQANRTYTGDVHVNTASAEAALSRVLAQLGAINKMGALQAQGVLPGGGGSSPRPSGSPRRAPRRPAKVVVNGRQFDGYIDEQIEADHDLAGERERAGRRGR